MTEQIGLMVEQPENEQVIMVHLNHPCQEIDVCHADPNHVPFLYGQGYMMLSELRHMKDFIVDQRAKIEAAEVERQRQRDAWLEIVEHKNGQIVNLIIKLEAANEEINRLTNAGLACAYGETMATDEAGEWFRVATEQREVITRLRAENAELTAKLAQLEDLCEMQSANLQRYAANEFEHNRRANDLRTKLEAANKELDELRIKAALMQPRPDWSKAPEWANWWAKDIDGRKFWYQKGPDATNGFWQIPNSSYLEDGNNLHHDWRQSKTQRPPADK
jgi:hypothetical protein